MRVLLDASPMSRPGGDRGLGRYVGALLDANQILGTDLSTITRSGNEGPVRDFVELPFRTAQVLRRPVQVYHAPTPYYAVLGSAPRTKLVVSVLDTIPLDLAGHRRTGTRARFFYRLAARADAILTLSQHAATRIADLLAVDASKIYVAPLPADPIFQPSGGTLDDVATTPYVAALGDFRTPDPRKRLAWLREVALALAEHGYRLVLVGSGSDDLIWPNTTALGRVSDAHWAAVLRGAQCLIYSSSYEGQGMPVLEALACGTPVVAMRNTALPEVVGSAGVLVDEVDDRPAPLIQACLELLANHDRLLACRTECAPQAARFSSRRFCAVLQQAYSE